MIYSNIKSYEEKWSLVYKKGIPDQAPTRLEQLGKAPSYRLLVRCLLKNDKQLVALGGVKIKSELYTKIKRDELRARGDLLEMDLL
jgi:predicted phosphoadenosine phosphosulfate sulfurtransferase